MKKSGVRTMLGTVAVAAACAGASPAAAQSLWGPRVGVGLDPDQFIVGLHFRPGAIADNLYLQPNVELGVGDDVTLLTLSMPLHYHFDTDFSAKPYAGAGASIGVWFHDDDHDHDHHDHDDSDFEVSIDLIGGLEWKMDSGNSFFTELKFGLGDLHDVELIGGWLF